MATRKAPSSRRASQLNASTGRSKEAATPALAVPTASMLSREAREQEARWRAESDLRTLREAEQIRADRQRFGNATRMAKAELMALEAITRRVKA